MNTDDKIQLEYEEIYQFADFTLSPKQKILLRDKEKIHLSERNIKCLLLLVRNPYRVVHKNEFFDTIWKDCFVGDGVLAVNIAHIRKAVGKNRIITYPQRGYKFAEEVRIIRNFDSAAINLPTAVNYNSSDRVKQMFSKVRNYLAKTLAMLTKYPKEF